MELQDYAVALRRHWTTWVGVTLTGLLVALVVVLVTPPTYQATAQVFVASVQSGTTGSQFVNQRVTSYPDVADSRTVLAPVIEELGLSESVAVLRAHVSATNPVDTSQIQIVVDDRAAVRAARIANAVAAHFGTAVEDLEQPGDGQSPVKLTVTNPAVAPTAPVSPVPSLLLPLGLVVGLLLGVAAAVVRGRLDTRLYTAEDIRSAWGADGDQLVVHTAPPRRHRRRTVPGRQALLVARQLEPLAEDRGVRVVTVAPAAPDQDAARAFADRVAAELAAWDVPVQVLGSPSDAPAGHGVQLEVGSATAPLREWRRIARSHAGAVVVLKRGQAHQSDIDELHSLLTTAGVPVIAVVLDAGRSGEPTGEEPDAPSIPARALVPTQADRNSGRARAGVPSAR